MNIIKFTGLENQIKSEDCEFKFMAHSLKIKIFHTSIHILQFVYCLIYLNPRDVKFGIENKDNSQRQ